MARLNGKLNGWRPGVPRLAEAGPAGPVETYYDPSSFVWHSDPSRTLLKMGITITPEKGEIRVLAAAGRKIAKVAEEMGIPSEGGRYQVEVGIMPRTIAIRLLPKGKTGFCLRQKSSRDSFSIHSYKLIGELQEAGWPLDHKIRMPAFWDEKNKMLVAKRV